VSQRRHGQRLQVAVDERRGERNERAGFLARRVSHEPRNLHRFGERQHVEGDPEPASHGSVARNWSSLMRGSPSTATRVIVGRISCTICNCLPLISGMSRKKPVRLRLAARG
jgi:hypothetical protein